MQLHSLIVLFSLIYSLTPTAISLDCVIMPLLIDGCVCIDKQLLLNKLFLSLTFKEIGHDIDLITHLYK